jgi:hypothetical protein
VLQGTPYIANIGLEAVQVHEKVDAMRGEGVHTSRVVGSLIDMIDPDSVGPKLLHKGGIAFALVNIDKRIVLNQLICNTCTSQSQQCGTNRRLEWAAAAVSEPVVVEVRSQASKIAIWPGRTPLTFDEELLALASEKLGASHRDGWDRIGDRREHAQH